MKMRKERLKIIKRRDFSFFFDWYSFLLFRYHSLFFCSLVRKGKKIKAFNKFLKLKQILKIKESIDPLLVFLVSMIRITPIIFLKPLRLGASFKGVPFHISMNKQIIFAIKWSILSAKTSKHSISIIKLSNNLLDAVYNKGVLIEKKKILYETGSNNRYLIRFYR